MTVYVTIYIWGEDLVPRRITEISGLNPTASATKGELPERPSKKATPAKTGMWSFSTRNNVEGDKVLDHLTFLEKFLGGCINELRNEGLIEAVRVALICTPEQRSDILKTWEYELETNSLALLMGMGASLSVAVLF